VDDFVVNVRQIGQYPRVTATAAADLLLLQQGGLGGPYASITPVYLLETALQGGGNLNLVAGQGAVTWSGQSLSFAGGTFNLSSQLSVPGISSTGVILIDGEAVALQRDVDTALQGLAQDVVNSVNGRRGDVWLQTSDILQAGAAPIVDAHFGGFITAPTAWDFRANSDQVATTAFVQLVINQLICGGSVVQSFNGRAGQVVLTVEDVNTAYAAAVAPDWPSAPNPALGDASNRIATTLFVDDSLQDLQQWMINYLASGGGVDLSAYAPLASPNFSGVPTAPTAAIGMSNGQIATTAFVHNAVVAATTGVASFNTRTGAVTLTLADVTNAGGAPLASPALTGTPTAPNAVLHNSSTQIATTAYVQGELAAIPTAPVTSFNTRTGAIVLTTADVTGAGGAPSASPALTGIPTAPTAATADSSTTLATTAFVHAAISALGTTVTSFNGRTGAITLIGNDLSAAGGALLAGPAFTGVPTAPTATVGTSSTQIASTAFVAAAIAAISAGVSSFNTRTGAVVLTLADVTNAGAAPVASPHLTGVPTAPTAAQTSNDTTLATTAYVQAAVAAGGVLSFNSRTGAVTLQANDVSAVGGALLAGPAFTGVPTAPTAATNTNTTQLATTAFVMAQLATTGGVTSFNNRAGAVTLSAADITATGQLALSTATYPQLLINSPTVSNLQITSQVNGLARWGLYLGNGTAETGSNAGSNFALVRFADNGAQIDVPFSIVRATGAATFSDGVAINSAAGLTVNNAGQASGVTVNASSGNPSITIASPNASCQWYWYAPSPAMFVSYGTVWMQLRGSDGAFLIASGAAYKPGGGAWADSSDDRIKTVKGDYAKGLDEVLALRPVEFVYQGNDTDTSDVNAMLGTGTKLAHATSAPYPASHHYQVAVDKTPFVGFVAQELEAIFPGMVRRRSAYIDGKPVADLRDVDVSTLIYALVNAVKTLAARVATLEAA
jgi:hypothetical protein